jgi:hypothetical protein
MVTFQATVCFGVGMGIVYMMFRSMRIFILLFVLGLSCAVMPAHAQTNWVAVQNWPWDTDDFTNAVPVQLVNQEQVNYLPDVAYGMGFGFTVCGFGWVVGMGKRIGSAHD